MKIGRFIKSLIVCVSLLTTSSLMAQNTNLDEVVLRNGSIIKGTITENTSEKISIKTSDGREYVFNKTEVEKTTQNGNTTTSLPINDAPLNASKPTEKQRYVPNKKGFWFSGEIQLLAPASLNLVAGYKLHQLAYLGLGTGIHNYTELQINNNFRPFTGTIIPIYVRYSGDILNRRVTPVYSLEIGYGIAATNGPMFSNNRIIYYDINGTSSVKLQTKGGIYGGIGFGFKVRTNKNISFGAGFTYRVQQSSVTEMVDSGSGTYDTNLTYKYLNQRFGLKLIFIGFN